ncbi:PAS domain-containing protein [Aquicoccus sp. SCR17]|nr:PAS domain-containing protein [Carideicomes alvinocaridis]
MPIPDPTILATLLCASATAAACAALVLRRGPSRAVAPPRGAEIRFLFRGAQLIESTPGADALLTLPAGGRNGWDAVRDWLSPRFPALAELRPEEVTQPLHLVPADADDAGAVSLLPGHGVLTLLLQEGATDPEARRALRRCRAELEVQRRALDAAPYQIWQSDGAGGIAWSNAPYRRLARHLGHADEETAPIFDLPEETDLPLRPRRQRLVPQQGGEPLWYDVTSVEHEGTWLHYAIDVNASVQAEIAQRNFVQTLAKTFAQLTTGLAIFDRRRRLALFNPALIDLTGLPVEFLARQPDLNSFFDRLRDTRIMPEPKDYLAWRRRISTLVSEASSDEYAEVWQLASGLTYRLSGRPHPDGAVAFLIEDITDEVSMSRRFRSELELGQSVVDTFDEAVAVFSRLGTMTLCNRAYRQLWQAAPEDGFAEVTIAISAQQWRATCSPGAVIDDLAGFVTRIGTREGWSAALETEHGSRVRCRAEPLPGGGTLIGFRSDPAGPAQAPEPRDAGQLTDA